jgi:hypothetical protein
MLPIRPLAAGLILALPLILPQAETPAIAEGKHAASAPVEITSDTREYCLQLFQRVSNMVRLSANPVPPEVTSLSNEGEQLCDHGHPKGGILRLRRALMLMEQGDGAAYR